MVDVWFQPLVWVDYRLALLFTLIFPFFLLIWAIFSQVEAIQRLMILYWRVASLLMISLYLMIPGWPIAFVTSFLARILIPISLWFWVDINDEIKDLPGSGLKMGLMSWRWAITLYCTLGAIATLPFLSCTFSAGAMDSSFCQVWLKAPWQYQATIHPNLSAGFIGFLGMVGLVVYVLYLAYFLVFRLGKQGRSALEQ